MWKQKAITDAPDTLTRDTFRESANRVATLEKGMSDQSGEHVHFWDDGRGQREVFIDGVKARGVIWCDTKAGIAVVHDCPLKSSDGETADFHPVWGEVVVVPTPSRTPSRIPLPNGSLPVIAR